MADSIVGQQLPLLRQSERSAFMKCPQMWYWAYVEALRPIAEKKTAADFGTGIHLALAEYYIPGKVRGVHPAETWDTYAKEMIDKVKTVEFTDDEQVVTWEDFHQLGLDLMNAYVEYWGGDPHWDILDAERRFSVTIPDVRFPPKVKDGKKAYKPICNLVGTFDLCFRDLSDGLIKMTDHKTCQAIYTQHLDMDPQASTYITVATKALRDQGLIGPDEVVKGMEYNFIRKGKVDDRPTNERGEALNKDGTISKRQPKPLFARTFVARTPKARNRTIVRISQESAYMEKIARGELPVLKNTNRECSFCAYYDLCELDENGEDTEYFKSTVFRKHDPYGDHREFAVNSKKVSEVEEAKAKGDLL